MSASKALPLPVVLSRVLGRLAADLEAAAGDDAPSLGMWSNVLRHVAEAGPGGIDERDLAEAARISRRTATAGVTGAARREWVGTTPNPRGKLRRVELAQAGRVATDVWQGVIAARQDLWERTPLRSVLEELVGRLPFELPHFPAPYGAADPSAIGGPYAHPTKGTDDLPSHGKDWKPVFRAEGDTVSGLPLTALLSQALMAFTIDYEDRFPWPLASTATVLCHLGADPRPLADVPGEHGITGSGKSLLERHLIAVVTRDPADKRRKLVALTDRGLAVMHHHPARLDAVEGEWRDRFGGAVVATLREELEPLARDATDQPDHVIAPLHEG